MAQRFLLFRSAAAGGAAGHPAYDGHSAGLELLDQARQVGEQGPLGQQGRRGVADCGREAGTRSDVSGLTV